MKAFLLSIFISTSLCNLSQAKKVNEVNYDEIKIGNQTWMSSNLNVDKFSNGDPIPQAKSVKEWIDACWNKKPVWCYFKNSKKYGEKYGKIYNLYAVRDPRFLAPEGWKIPYQEQWVELINSLGGYEMAGKKLKSKSGWDGQGTDNIGFNGIAGGFRLYNGNFTCEEICTYWWSLTGVNGKTLLFHAYGLSTKDNSVQARQFSDHYGLYVRCVKK